MCKQDRNKRSLYTRDKECLPIQLIINEENCHAFFLFDIVLLVTKKKIGLGSVIIKCFFILTHKHNLYIYIYMCVFMEKDTQVKKRPCFLYCNIG